MLLKKVSKCSLPTKPSAPAFGALVAACIAPSSSATFPSSPSKSERCVKPSPICLTTALAFAVDVSPWNCLTNSPSGRSRPPLAGVGYVAKDQHLEGPWRVPVRAGRLARHVLLGLLAGGFVNFGLFRIIALSLIRERRVGVESGKRAHPVERVEVLHQLLHRWIRDPARSALQIYLTAAGPQLAV